MELAKDNPSGISIAETTSQEEQQMAIVQIIRPELTPEERAKRMEAIKKATVELIVATEKAKALKTRSTI